jgi:hypothetical protein
MSFTNTEFAARFLAELKAGSLLTKRKRDGENYPRRYFLHENEYFVTYELSEKNSSQPRRCKFNCFS